MNLWVPRDEWTDRVVDFKSRVELLVPSEHRGVVIHYTASQADEQTDHERCADRVRAIEEMQIRNGYDAIAYHRLVCRHGYTFQGRPLRYRSQGCQGAAKHAHQQRKSQVPCRRVPRQRHRGRTRPDRPRANRADPLHSKDARGLARTKGSRTSRGLPNGLPGR